MGDEANMRFLPFQTPSDVTPEFQGRRLCLTGHRPTKLGGYSDEARAALRQLAVDWLTALRPVGLFDGVAQGFDAAVIEAAWVLNIPYVACVPFSGQQSQWPIEARKLYDQYLERAAKVIICSPGGYAPEKMQIRNERMVDLALSKGIDQGLLLAMWDRSGGGTRNCLDYASRRGIPMINAWADFLLRRSV
jgi:uncharacterized phage-like protein YoqJ